MLVYYGTLTTRRTNYFLRKSDCLLLDWQQNLGLRIRHPWLTSLNVNLPSISLMNHQTSFAFKVLFSVHLFLLLIMISQSNLINHNKQLLQPFARTGSFFLFILCFYCQIYCGTLYLLILLSVQVSLNDLCLT